MATSLSLQRRAGMAGKLLAALLALWLLWLIGANVTRMVRQRSDFAAVQSGPLSTQSAAQQVIGANLFGASVTPRAAEFQPSSLNVRLKGVYAAEKDFSGFAILAVDNGPDIGVLAGSELKPGIKLNAVHSDHILITHDGLIERVNLAPLKGSPSGAPGRLASNSQSVHVQPLSANAFSVSRGEFTSLLSDPLQLAKLAMLGTNPGGGIVVNDAADSILISKLGLRQGDIIQKVNGQAIAGKDDLLKIAMQTPDTIREVSVEGTRNGQPLHLSYNVQP